jgi:kynureninase
MKGFKSDIEFAEKLDLSDPLYEFREKFLIADPDLIYVDGNSLGRMPKAAAQIAARQVEEQWGKRLIRGWGEEWIFSPERVGAKIAKIIGASPDEVIIADSTSVNLFKLVVAALRFLSDRKSIVTDDLNFPSDLYILRGAVDLIGDQHLIKIIESIDGVHGPEEALIESLTADTALLTLSQVVFKSGYLYDIQKMTKAAHNAGALTLWDLSHSVGAVPINLNQAGVDLAVGCTYKYLNGGPGAPAFIFIRKDLQKQLFNPLSGWMGSERMFDFSLEYRPDPGIRRFLTGTPSVISLSLIEPGADLIIEAGIERIRKKSELQLAYLEELITSQLKPLGVQIKTPTQAEFRGSHISISHTEGLRINKALIEQMNVIPDFRSPDNIRLGVAPLYTRFVDLFEVVWRIKEVIESKKYEQYSNELPTVT